MGVKIKSTGGGSVTLDVPSTASDFLLNLPAVGGNVVTTGDSGTIRPNMLNGGQTGNAPGYVARAWVNFNGAGTVSIRGSGNVSSISDNGVGRFAINFSTPLVDTQGSVVAMTNADQSTSPTIGARVNIDGFVSSANEARIFVSDSSSQSFYDPAYVNAAIFR